MLKLNSVMIGTEDAERLATFYGPILGTPIWEDQGFTAWQLGEGALMVGPHSEVSGRNASPGRIMFNLETPDVQGEFERVKGTGATVVQEPYQPAGPEGGFWMATFADPDGNYFQLTSPMPVE